MYSIVYKWKFHEIITNKDFSMELPTCCYYNDLIIHAKQMEQTKQRICFRGLYLWRNFAYYDITPNCVWIVGKIVS